jgi:hypothetical protein
MAFPMDPASKIFPVLSAKNPLSSAFSLAGGTLTVLERPKDFCRAESRLVSMI